MIVIKKLKDILFVLMQIELSFSKLYRTLAIVDNQYPDRLKTIMSVLAKEEESHYEWYKGLLEDVNLEDIPVEEDIYEITVKNLESFKDSISTMRVTYGIIQTAYDYELKNGETLWTILGFIEKYKKNEDDPLSKFLADLIKMEESHAANLKQFLKN